MIGQLHVPSVPGLLICGAGDAAPRTRGRDWVLMLS
jgi:hypothetical protein